MNDTPNRRTRRAAAATAPVAPAIEASADRAAIERDPSIDAAGPPVTDSPIVPGNQVVDDAKVLPEPTLVAEPGKPMPIVTASPILAVEPSAIDVVQAEAKADRVAAGLEPAADPDGPHSVAAGQPTLTIEGNAIASALKGAIADGSVRDITKAVERISANRDSNDAGHRYGFGDGVSSGPEYGDGDVEGLIRELTDVRRRNQEQFDRIYFETTGRPWSVGEGMDLFGDGEVHSRDRIMEDGFLVLTLDEVVHGLERLALSDPIGMDIIRTRFFAEPDRAFADREPRPAGRTVTVIEVVGPAQGRRRAGRSFGTQPQRFLAGELDEDEIATLRSDPLLAVGVSEVEADAFGMPIAAG